LIHKDQFGTFAGVDFRLGAGCGREAAWRDGKGASMVARFSVWSGAAVLMLVPVAVFLLFPPSREAAAMRAR
jgi:hypothetical protein